jgi:lysozyme
MPMSFSEEQIKKHEGFSKHPYRDTEGVLTIGYGRNLEKGISQEAADFLFAEDMTHVLVDCFRFSWYADLDTVRQAVIENMVFNLGFGRFSQFKKMIAAIIAEDWNKASKEMMNSKWAKQVGYRAEELAFMMRTGQEYDY